MKYIYISQEIHKKIEIKSMIALRGRRMRGVHGGKRE